MLNYFLNVLKWTGNAIILMILSKRFAIDWSTFPVGRFPGFFWFYF